MERKPAKRAETERIRVDLGSVQVTINGRWRTACDRVAAVRLSAGEQMRVRKDQPRQRHSSATIR